MPRLHRCGRRSRGTGPGLPEVADRLLVTALPHVDDAQFGQHMSLTDPVTGLPAQGQGLLQVAGGLLIAALPQLAARRGCPARGLRRPGRRSPGTGRGPAGDGRRPAGSGPAAQSTMPRLPSARASPTRSPVSQEQGQGLPVALGGLLVAALPHIDDAEVCQRAGLRRPGHRSRGTGPGPAGGGLWPAGSGPAASRRGRGWSARRPRPRGRRLRGRRCGRGRG